MSTVIDNPLFDVGSIVGTAPATGIVKALSATGAVVTLEAWNPATGDTTHHAPAGSNAGGGTRRHLFDRELYVDTDGAGTYANVRSWAAITGTPTTVQGFGITNAARLDSANTFTSSNTVQGAQTVTNGVANPATSGTIRLPNTGAIRWRNAANTANLGIYLSATDVLTVEGAMTVGGHITPSSDNAFDFGNGTFRFRDATFSRNVVAGSLVVDNSTPPILSLKKSAVQQGYVGYTNTVLNALDIYNALNAGIGFYTNGTRRGGFAANGVFDAVGDATVGGALSAATFTATGVNATDASFGVTPSNGLNLRAKVGTGYDFALTTPAGAAYIMRVPTGTSSIEIVGPLTTFGGITAGSDNAHDFGQPASNRFRDFYLARNATIGGTITVTGTPGTVAINSGSHANFIANRNSTAAFAGLNLQTAGSGKWLIGTGATGVRGEALEFYNTGGSTTALFFDLTNTATFSGSIAAPSGIRSQGAGVLTANNTFTALFTPAVAGAYRFFWAAIGSGNPYMGSADVIIDGLGSSVLVNKTVGVNTDCQFSGGAFQVKQTSGGSMTITYAMLVIPF